MLRLLSVMLLLSGCATDPVSNSQATPVKALAYASPIENGATLIVKRDSGFMGAACKTTVHLDGQKVASLGPADLVTLYIPVGEHIVGAVNGGVCGGAVSESGFTVTANATKTYHPANGVLRSETRAVVSTSDEDLHLYDRSSSYPRGGMGCRYEPIAHSAVGDFL